MRPILLAAVALWSVTTFVVAAQQPPAPATPQAGQATPQSSTPEKKKNPFEDIEEAEPENTEPQKTNRFADVEADPQKKNRFADVEEEDEFAGPETVTSLRRFYSGTKACTKCHEKQAKAYREGPMSHYWNARTPAADIGCETCHGPGKAHDDAPAVKGLIRGFKGVPAREATDVCLTCHNREEHAGWQGGLHDARNVGCTSCHSVHKPQSERGHLKAASVDGVCASCHQEKAARLQRASHMPLREGKMECSTCHNPHGSVNVRMLRAGSTINESCQSCHTEKRGPFLFEHKPVTESCTTCHDAHGSSNDRMLIARQPMLCQRCHIATRHPATPYDALTLTAGNNRLIGRSCMNCHQMVHGSNHPSGLFLQR